MTSKKSDLLKLILIILIIIVFLALFILVFSWVCYILPIDFPGTISDWITSLSALAGGALTLFGVWWTIKDAETKRKEELSIQFKPYLKFNNDPVAFQDEDIFIEMIDNDNEIYLPMSIELKNIGRGEAIISSIDILPIDNLSKQMLSKQMLSKQMISIEYIFSEEYIMKDEITKLNLKIYSSNCFDSIITDRMHIKYKIIVNYTDLYKKNTYKKNFDLIFETRTMIDDLSNHEIFVIYIQQSK